MEFNSTRKHAARLGERGQVLPLFALASVVMFGAASLAVDVGFWRYQERLAHTAADSAAIAGAGELAYPAAADFKAAAMSDASANGFTDDGGARVTVDAHSPPTSGAYAGNIHAVEVIVTKKQPSFFDGIFGNVQSISVRAVAALNQNGIYCVYALAGNIDLGGGGGGGITAPTCGLITNQNLVVTGGANVDARSIGYVGSGPGGGTYPLSQPMKTLPVADPCPTIAGCAYLTDLTLNHPGVLHSGCQPFPVPNPLPPGEYCVPLSGSLTLAPGLFVLDQGMTSGNMTGSGVTIYNAGTRPIVYSGNVNVILSAPTSGPTAGMVYFQPSSTSASFSFTKNGASGTVDLIGGFYAPSCDFTFNGDLPSITLLVAKSIRMNGGGLTVPNTGGLARNGYGVLAE